MELDLLSLDSVVRFCEAWNSRSAPLHALINNAGIFSIGGLDSYIFFLIEDLRLFFFIYNSKNINIVPLLINL